MMMKMKMIMMIRATVLRMMMMMMMMHMELHWWGMFIIVRYQPCIRTGINDNHADRCFN